MAVEDIPEEMFKFEALVLLVTAMLLVTGTTPDKLIVPLVAADRFATGKVTVRVNKVISVFMFPP
jgi:hypothetical protein